MGPTNQRKEFKPIPMAGKYYMTTNQRKEFKPIPMGGKCYGNNESKEKGIRKYQITQTKQGRMITRNKR
jgi:hypothetical protein